MRDPDRVAELLNRVILKAKLGEAFRRDAMKKPVVVAGINRADMRPQLGAH